MCANDSEDKPAVNRRSFLQATATASSLIGVSGVASAGSDEILLRNESRNASNDEIDRALSFAEVQTLLEEVGHPRLTRREAQRVDTYAGRRRIGHLINIPTEYGTLHSVFSDGEFSQTTIALSRGNARDKFRRFAGGIGWPDDVWARVSVNRGETGATFYRGVSMEEQRRIQQTVGQESARTVISASRELPTGDKSRDGERGTQVSGQYDALYAGSGNVKLYHIHRNGRKVLDVERIRDGRVSVQGYCTDKAGLCLIDIIMAVPHCAAAAAACGILGPVTAGCVVAVFGICGPNVALVAVSGNCESLVRHCL